jgi:TRAP-type C4-dicarboxylate transport system substrate-binding protein
MFRILAVSLVSSLIAASPALAQEVTLRLHQFLPAQSMIPANVLDPWADAVEEQSGGRIRIERYPSMQLGGTPPQLIDQVTDGSVDLVWTLPGYTPGRFPGTEVFELPFMMTTAEAASRAFWDIFEARLKDAEFSEVHVIGTWVHGPGVIHSLKPVRSLDDMAGLKLRAPSRIITQVLSAVGATAIGMPVPQVPESISKGVIDGAVIPWEVTGSLRVPELVPYHTEFSGDHAFYTATFVLAMNKARYEGLPDDLKAVIDANSGAEFSANAGRVQQSFDAPNRQVAVDRGNEVIVLDEAETTRWREAAQPVIDGWVAEMDARGMDGAGLLDEARTLIERYTTTP